MKYRRLALLFVLLSCVVAPVAAKAQAAPGDLQDSPLARPGAAASNDEPTGEKRSRPVAMETAAAAEEVPVSHLVFRSMGEWVGGGQVKQLSSLNNDKFNWSGNGNSIRLWVDTASGTWWSLWLSAPAGQRIEVGEYLRATRDSFKAPTSSGIDFGGDGRGCNRIAGHFKVQEAVYREDGSLETFRATFRQFCEEAGLPLVGEVRLGIPEAPPVPAPVPPAPGSLVMVSEPGDWVGAGRTWVHSSTSGFDTFGWTGHSTRVNIGVDTAADGGWWTLTFDAPNGRDLTPGYYPNATRYPFNAPEVPGLSVGGQGRGCNKLTGEFTIYEAVWGSDEDFANRLLRFDASFVQYCDNGPALTGEVQLGIPDPFDVLTQVGSRMTVGRSGSAHLVGRVTCTINGSATLQGTVTQEKAGGVEVVPFSTTIPCNKLTTTWRVTVTPEAGAFRPGTAVVNGMASAADVYGQSNEQPFSARVRLVPRP